jgi:hypothetical protein
MLADPVALSSHRQRGTEYVSDYGIQQMGVRIISTERRRGRVPRGDHCLKSFETRLQRPIVAASRCGRILIRRNCPRGQKPPFSPVNGPARPHETAIQNRFTVGNAEAAWEC